MYCVLVLHKVASRVNVLSRLNNAPTQDSPDPPAGGRGWTVFGPRAPLLPLLFIVVGTFLRLAYPLEFEWKLDEQRMFYGAQNIAQGKESFPWVGLPSSAGIPHPGLSVWPFALMAYVARTPEGLTHGVMCLNALALLGFALWVRCAWPAPSRNLGYWAIALLAVSPFAVLYSRKLWAPDVLPVFLLPWLWCHSLRKTPLFSFLWGLFGALLGQVHMAGFFAALGLVVATLWVDRHSVRVFPWLFGSAWGSIPLLLWIHCLLQTSHPPASHSFALTEVVVLAITTTWGTGLEHSLGPEMATFMRGPLIAGTDTGLVSVAHWMLGAIGVYAAAILYRDRRKMECPDHLRTALVGVSLGIIFLSLAFVPLYEHYLIVFCPLLQVAWAWILSRRRQLLVVVTLLQLFLSASFLFYIHGHAGARSGDFGVTYEEQVRQVRD